MISLDELYMREALKSAKKAEQEDEVPIGAVIIHKNQIIAKAHNQVELLKDPTAHAEMIAITQATNALQAKWLQDCTMYVTIEPCSMCAGALVLARIGRVCFGSEDPKTGACGSVFNIAQSEKLNHRFEVLPGVLRNDCGSLLTDYFRKKRRLEN